MCDDLDDRYWHPIGATPWSGEFCIIEQCGDCLEYRARVIDPNTIPVVEGLPEMPTGEATDPDEASVSEAAPEPDETSSTDDSDDDDWLVR